MSNVSSSNSHKVTQPTLRFNGYTEEWMPCLLSNVACYLKVRNTAIKSVFISTENMRQNCAGIEQYVDSSTVEGIAFNTSDILIANIRPYLKKAWQATFNGVCSTDVLALHITNALPEFIYRIIENDNFFTYVMSAAKGSKMPRGDKQHIMDYHIAIPCIQEQQKISDFLQHIDLRIAKQRQIIDSLISYKRGLIFSIFSNDNAFGIPMTQAPLFDLLTEYRVKDTKDLRVCSVAVNKGVVDQIEHLGRSFSATDTSNYGRVKFGDIVYTKSPTGDFPYGIVKQNKLNEVVAVSPLYGVYTPKTFEVGNLLHYYFEQHENANNYIRPLAQKGAKNTINITNQTFLQGMILFPYNDSDCARLCNILNALEQNIIKQEKLLFCLQQQKKWLLQKMFI